MSARDELDRWQALADGATEGPWGTYWFDQDDGWLVFDEESGEHIVASVADDADDHQPGRDAEFIAARTIVPAAVKALRDVLDELDEWERAGHLSIEMVHIRNRIEAAIGGEGS